MASSCCVCLSAGCRKTFNIFNGNVLENVAAIITKHLWFQPTEDAVCQTICFECWTQLHEFHQFYNKVEEAHKNLLSIKLDGFKQEKYFVNEYEDEIPDVIHNQAGNSEFYNFAELSGQNRNPFQVYGGDDSKLSLETNDNTVTDNFQTSEIEESDINLSSAEKKPIKLLKKTAKMKKSNSVSPRKGIPPPKYDSEEIDGRISSFMTLSCDICTVKFPKFAILKSHFRKEHNRSGYAVCCKRRYHKRCLLLEHINSHINPEFFKCTQCEKVLASKESLRQHMTKIHNPKIVDREELECKECHKVFAEKINLRRHLALHIPQDQWSFKCDDCGKLCASKFILQSHYNDSHRNRRVCQICGQVLQSKRFTEHMEKHAGIEETKVQCEICGAWMKNKKHLQVHMSKHSDANKIHKCTICGKLSPNNKALNIHIKYTHSQQKNHECSICHKTFKRPLVLKQHMAGHTGNPLYTCKYCPKTFIYDSHYHNHKKKAHREQWEADKAANAKIRTNFLKVKNENL